MHQSVVIVVCVAGARRCAIHHSNTSQSAEHVFAIRPCYLFRRAKWRRPARREGPNPRNSQQHMFATSKIITPPVGMPTFPFFPLFVLTESGRNWPNPRQIGRICSNSNRHHSQIGGHTSNIGRISPKLADIAPNSAQIRSTSPEFGRIRSRDGSKKCSRACASGWSLWSRGEGVGLNVAVAILAQRRDRPIPESLCRPNRLSLGPEEFGPISPRPSDADRRASFPGKSLHLRPPRRRSFYDLHTGPP